MDKELSRKLEILHRENCFLIATVLEMAVIPEEYIDSVVQDFDKQFEFSKFDVKGE